MKKEYRVAESNQCIKDWHSAKLKIALVFPNVYSGGMSGYTVQVLYELFNRHPEVVCERIFLPYEAIEKKYMSNRPGRELKPILSLETGHEMRDFDWIAFSVHYELDYPYILWLLDNGHIPIQYSQREGEEYPLILIGGPAFRSNGLPLQNFIDCGLIGDFEPVWESTLNLWIQTNSQDISMKDVKTAFLQQISSIPGWWTPHHPTTTKASRVWLPNLDESPVKIPPLHAIFDPPDSNPLTFGDSILLEINRGCPHGCRFCMTGFQNRPFRNRSLSTIKRIICEHLKSSKNPHFTLIGASVTDHPDFLAICQYLLDQHCQFSVPSIRIDTVTPEYAKLLQMGGMKTIAIAPEAGSDALRKRLNKHLTNEQIIRGCRILKESGIENLKLYLLFGLPFEQDQELEEMVALVHTIAELGFNKWGVRISLNPFIPKAHTPFERSIDMYTDIKLSELIRRLEFLERKFKPDSRIKMDSLPVIDSFIQTVFSLGDRTIGSVIEACYESGLSTKKWYQLIKREHFPEIQTLWDRILSSVREDLPWNIIHQGYSNDFLEDEWIRAEKGKFGVECAEGCQICGCCSKDNT
jgi:radical SAM superfamily enzyme YgiQ (UPF0313 family)